jgi:hypothetical protein
VRRSDTHGDEIKSGRFDLAWICFSFRLSICLSVKNCRTVVSGHPPVLTLFLQFFCGIHNRRVRVLCVAVGTFRDTRRQTNSSKLAWKNVIQILL